MVNRQSILDELQELRTLVRQQDCDQVQLHVRLFVHTCDRLTTPIVSPPKGASYDPQIYPAEDIGLSLPWSGHCAVTLPKLVPQSNPIRRTN